MLEAKLELSDKALTLVDRIERKLQAGALVKAAKDAGNVVAKDAKPRITRPGYKGDKKGLTPLRNTLKVVVRDYETRVIAVVGTTWPKGAHGHLVENGHLQKLKDGRTIHVPPHPFLRPAAEGTKSQQNQAVMDVLKRESPSQ